jgi:hypothetical protein
MRDVTSCHLAVTVARRLVALQQSARHQPMSLRSARPQIGTVAVEKRVRAWEGRWPKKSDKKSTDDEVTKFLWSLTAIRCTSPGSETFITDHQCGSGQASPGWLVAHSVGHA